MAKCKCVFANASNTSSVRTGHEVGGYLKVECDDCKAKRAAPVEVKDLVELIQEMTGALSLAKYNKLKKKIERAMNSPLVQGAFK